MVECYNVEHSTPKYISKQFMKADLTPQKEKYTAKVMPGYYERKITNDTQIDKHVRNYWKKKINLLRHNRKAIFLLSKTKNYPPNILDTKELKTVEKPLIAIINVDSVLPMLKI